MIFVLLLRQLYLQIVVSHFCKTCMSNFKSSKTTSNVLKKAFRPFSSRTKNMINVGELFFQHNRLPEAKAWLNNIKIVRIEVTLCDEFRALGHLLFPTGWRWRDSDNNKKSLGFSASSTKKQRPCMKTHVKFACLLMMLTREPFLFYTYTEVTLSSIRSLLQKAVLSPCNVANGFDPRDIQVNNTSQSWSCWRISWIFGPWHILTSLEPWLLKISYISLRHYSTHNSASAFCQNCKAYLVQGSLQVLIGFQSIWDQHSLAAKNTVA